MIQETRKEKCSMFREMARKNQQLDTASCLQLLTDAPRGVLSLLGDGGYPYGVPMDHWYNPEDGRIYFHSGKRGHKIDAIRCCDKASFCVMDEGWREAGDWALNFRSVIAFGRIEIVEDPEKALEITRKLSYKYTDDTAMIEAEILESRKNLLVFALVPEHITGKRVKES